MTEYFPITRKEAEYLAHGTACYPLGCLLIRLVYAGAKPEANAILDSLSEPLEEFMTSTECYWMTEPDMLGYEWANIRVQA